MGTVILRRLVSLIPLLFILSIGVFAMSLQLDPDRAAYARAGGIDSTPESLEAAKEDMGLNDPPITRYFNWLGDVLHGDLGESLVATEAAMGPDGTVVQVGQSVAESIKTALPRTLSIAMVGLLFGAVVGLVVGILGGLKPGSLVDRFSVMLATLGLAIPSFWLVMILIVFFSVNRDLLPATGYEPISNGVWPWLSHILLPGIAVGTAVAAITARQLRASMMDVLGKAYIRTAWAKGSSGRRVIVHHALKNALSAPLTTFGNMFAHLLGGAIVIETLVGINGVGTLTREAVRTNDVTMLQGLVLFFATVTVLINLGTDIAYSYLNPKVRLA